MFRKVKNFFLQEVLSKELDTIQIANIIIVYYVVMLALGLLIPLQIMYLFIGNYTQLFIGIISITVFASALVCIKIQKRIDLVAHGIMIFSTSIFCVNIFMYPNAEFVNGLLLGCNIIFAFNFFNKIAGLSYTSVHLIATIFYYIAQDYNIDTSFITPINQPLTEKISTLILLFIIIVVLIIHYQTAHRKAALKLNNVIDDLKVSEDRRKKSQVIGKIGNWEFNIQTKESSWEEESSKIFGSEMNFKYSFEELMDYFYKEDKLKMLEIINSKETIKSFEFEPRVILHDGLEKSLAIYGELQYDKTGKPLKYLGIIQDITERKKAEIEQKKLLEITNFQNSKLKNFAYIVSHNIRSHSSNITSLVELLDNTKTEEERNVILEMLKKTTSNLDTTLQNLNTIITTTENSSKPKVKVQLKAEVLKTLDILAGDIYQHDIETILNVAEDHKIEVIPSYCDSILLNIISNAIKYRSAERKLKINISSSIEGNYCTLSIKDNGKGIDMAKNGNKLFGMYKTFHENDDARGIGLFITKNHIEAMNGKIEVESQENIGSTFKISFYKNDSE